MPTIKRDELYELVWSTPLRDLAQQFGLSDVGLAKICKRLGVPRPSQGHWARVLNRRKTARPPLSAIPPGTPDRFVVDDPPRVSPAEPNVPGPPKPTVGVSAKLVNPRPVIRQISGMLKSDFRSKDMQVVRYAIPTNGQHVARRHRLRRS